MTKEQPCLPAEKGTKLDSWHLIPNYIHFGCTLTNQCSLSSIQKHFIILKQIFHIIYIKLPEAARLWITSVEREHQQLDEAATFGASLEHLTGHWLKWDDALGGSFGPIRPGWSDVHSCTSHLSFLFHTVDHWLLSEFHSTLQICKELLPAPNIIVVTIWKNAPQRDH